MMKYKAKEIYTGIVKYEESVLEIENGKIRSICRDDDNKDEVNSEFENYRIIPGFIDIHNHGGYGIDFSSASTDDITEVLKKFPEEGITTVIPTAAALTKEGIHSFINEMRSYADNKVTGITDVKGFHLEGPFLNPKRAGMINPESMIEPEVHYVEKLIKQSEGLFKIMTIAPEMPGALDVISLLSKNSIVASAGHSDATMDEMNEAIQRGTNQITHLFNGMRPLHHREPGILGVGLTNNNVYAETVGFDTHSIYKNMWKMMYDLKGPNRMILSTDANILKGLPDGKYTHNGRDIEFKNGRIYTAYQGGDMHPGVPMSFIDSVKNVLRYTGATLEDIAIMAAVNPAKQLGIFDSVGSLSDGKDADFLVVDDDYTIVATYCKGELSYSRESDTQ